MNELTFEEKIALIEKQEKERLAKKKARKQRNKEEGKKEQIILDTDHTYGIEFYRGIYEILFKKPNRSMSKNQLINKIKEKLQTPEGIASFLEGIIIFLRKQP